MLVEAGADKEAKDKYGNTPLHSAANRFAGLTVLKGHALVIKVLVKAGASKETRNHAGKTPRQEAMSAHHTAAVRILR